MPRAETDSISAEETDSLDGWERALLDRQLEALNRLADMGMAMAAAISGRATAEEPVPDADLNRAAMDFARVSRAVRMTFALQSRLIAEFKGVAAPGKAGAAYDGPVEVQWLDPDPVEEDLEQQRQVRAAIERLGEAAALDREAVERLVCETRERLEDERIHDYLFHRPVSEIVALICQDLGLEPDWSLLADTCWAQGEIAQNPPGSPYAGWKQRRALARAPPRAGELSRSD
jgi:hypothetical protein